MERIKVSNNFYLDELVDPVTYFAENDNGLSKLDPKIIDCLQLLRDLKGSSIVVNNWWLPYQEWVKKNPNKNVEDFSKFFSKRGNFQWSGYRSAKCTIGSKYSAHKLGKAVDPKGDEKELMKIVEDNRDKFYELGLRRLEDIKITKGWLHMDTNPRNLKPGLINVVDLKQVVRRF